MIRLSNAIKTYDRGETAVHALRAVSLTVAEGEFLAIMGPSGSGKSTLLHILGLLDVVDRGDYALCGRKINTLADEGLAEMRNTVIGFVFQHFNLLARTSALENVLLPTLYSHHSADRAQGAKMLAEVGLLDRAAHTPNELSGGQQQRVAIARALINNPRLILADEPTGNLDSASAREIMEIFTGLNKKGLTVVMVTHEEDIAAYARRVIHMRDGVIQKDEASEIGNWPASSGSAKGGKFEIRKPALPGHPGEEAPQIANRKSKIENHGDGWSLLRRVAANIKQAGRALKANKVRSALSMLGILIGVAAVIAMLAIGKGAEQSIQAQLSSMGSNLLIMRPGAPYHGGVSMAEGMVTRFTREDISDIKKDINTISRIGGVVSGRAQSTYGGKNWNTQIMGVEPDYAAMHACEPAIGRFFTDEDLVAKARVAVIGLTVVRALFGDENPLGEFVKMNKVNFQVIGVLPEKGSTSFWDQDDRALVPLTTAMDRLLGAQYLNMVEMEVARPEDIDSTQEAIKELVIRTHRLPPSRLESFNIRNMAEMKAALSETSRVMAWLLSSIAAVSMLVGGIGIMNIMLVSVTERTREIGTRKAVGARRRDILLQFLTEALVISLLGGLLGIGLGWLISAAVSSLAGWASIVTMFSVAIAVSFSALIGIVFGLWPARKAAGLNPIDALRYE